MTSPVIKPQISLGFDDIITPKSENILASEVLVDRGSKYGYGFTQVQ
ncbi:hypothetical protein GW830_00140 [bacterium]|nr:hypothetical protein [bacterium]